MADGHFPTLVSKDRDANVVGNPIWVEISDGAAALHKFVDAVAGAADAGLAPLAVRDDVLGGLTEVEGDYVQVRVDGNGALWVHDVAGGSAGPSKVDDSAFAIGTDAVSPSGFLADEVTPDSVDEGDVGLARMTLDRKQLFVLVDPTTDANRLAIDASGYVTANINGSVTVVQATHDNLNANANIQVGDVDVANGNPVPVSDAGGSLTVDATDLDIRTLTLAEDAVKVSGNTNPNAETNPIFVQVVSGVVSGTEVHDYDTASAVAGDATSNHDYAVGGTTFLLKSMIFASSGGGKVEVQAGPIASLASVAVGFIPKDGGVIQLEFNPPVEVPATGTGTVRLIRTNRQGQSQDLYSTIIGNDLA